MNMPTKPSEALQLNPCPFCDGQNHKPEMRSCLGDSWVHCTNCEASSKMCGSAESAAHCWNRRAVQASADEWQPIDTAPKDGSRILAWEKWPFQDAPRQRIIYWNHEGNCVIPAYLNAWICEVTTTSRPEQYILGWHPLPATPHPANDNREKSAAA